MTASTPSVSVNDTRADSDNTTLPAAQNEPAVVKFDGPKHTPGPWFAGGYLVYLEPFGSGRYVANADSPFVRAEHVAANARLIAAAPDMLEALQLVAHDVRSGSLPTNIQNAISAAIARATGAP